MIHQILDERFDGISGTWTGDDMKKLLAASVTGLALLSGSALAADLPPAPQVYKAPAVVAPAYSWTGCYIDGGGGAGMWNQSHYNYTTATGFINSFEQTTGGRGWYGEVGGGCDYQFSMGTFGNVVIGVLGGYDFMDLKGAYSDSFNVVATGYEKESNAGFVGGRIGFLVTPNLLTYTSGGWTESRFNGFTSISPVGAAFNFVTPAHTYNGYFLGGGLEYSLAGWLGLPQGLFLRSDYRWSTFKAANINYLTTSGAPFGTSTRSNIYTMQLGTELIYRFNWQ